MKPSLKEEWESANHALQRAVVRGESKEVIDSLRDHLSSIQWKPKRPKTKR